MGVTTQPAPEGKATGGFIAGGSIIPLVAHGDFSLPPLPAAINFKIQSHICMYVSI